MTELKFVASPEESAARTAAALERIATALEQMALNQMATPLEPLMVGLPTGEPPLPEPPAEYVRPVLNAPQSATIVTQTVPLPPVQAPTPRWAAGMNHAAGHKPLKENNRGLYCPTKAADGTWCQWAVPK